MLAPLVFALLAGLPLSAHMGEGRGVLLSSALLSSRVQVLARYYAVPKLETGHGYAAKLTADTHVGPLLLGAEIVHRTSGAWHKSSARGRVGAWLSEGRVIVFAQQDLAEAVGRNRQLAIGTRLTTTVVHHHVVVMLDAALHRYRQGGTWRWGSTTDLSLGVSWSTHP